MASLVNASNKRPRDAGPGNRVAACETAAYASASRFPRLEARGSVTEAARIAAEDIKIQGDPPKA